MVNKNQTSDDITCVESIEKELYPGKGLPGGGQLEVRMEITSQHPDPDILEFNPILKNKT